MAPWDQAEETKKGRGKMVGGKGGRGSKKEKADEGEEEASTSHKWISSCDGPPVWARMGP